MPNSSTINFRELAKSKIAALKSTPGFEIYDYKTPKGISQANIEKMEKIMQCLIPEELIQFYSSMNGCSLNWSCEIGKINLYGFWSIWPLEWVFFGWGGRISSSAYKDPFEDVLWNDYYEEKEILELKKHKLIEPIESENAHITFKLETNKVVMYFVDDGKCKPLPIDFITYIHLIIESLGVSEIRNQIRKAKFMKNPLAYRDLKIVDSLIKMDMSFL